MSPCNFKCLLQLLRKQLDLDQQLDVYDHLGRCDICRDTVHQLSRDLDQVLFIYRAHGVGHYAVRRQIKRAWSGRAHVS